MDEIGLKAVNTAKKAYAKCIADNSGGTYWPGQCARDIDPELLRKISEDVSTVLITGTNGKTTTTSMVSHMLERIGIRCVSNRSGANMDTGIFTTFALGTDEAGKAVANQAVIECDEKYLGKMASQLKPEIIVLTNLSVDQTSRMKNPNELYREIIEGIRNEDAVLCVNDSCEYFREIERDLPGHRIVRFCVSSGDILIDGRRYDNDVNLDGEYNYENLAAAASVLYVKGILNTEFSELLYLYTLPFGRLERIKVKGREAVISLVKNKVSAEKTLEYIAKQNKEYTVVIGFNISLPDGTDPAWIESIDWETYRDYLKDVYTYGTGLANTGKALQKAGICACEINDFQELHHFLLLSEKPVFLMLNYTCMMQTKKELAELKYIRPFWENRIND